MQKFNTAELRPVERARAYLQKKMLYRYPQSFPQSAAALIACSHYQSPIVKYGTVERSDLAKCRQDELCCRRTIRRWNPEARGFRLMYGTPTADEKKFIHTPVSTKSSVPVPSPPVKGILTQPVHEHENHRLGWIRLGYGELTEKITGPL